MGIERSTGDTLGIDQGDQQTVAENGAARHRFRGVRPAQWRGRPIEIVV
jgi:hypothetical protein